MNDIKISVFTPTYNRGYCLDRLFNSLKSQTDMDFEWIIIDDGSTDNTKEIVEHFISDSRFRIIYFWKENGGRHTAFNKAVELCNSDFIISIDSDDELLPTAIEEIRKTWEAIPNCKRGKIWQMSFLCVDTSGQIIGNTFNKKINNYFGRKQHKLYIRATGEKSCCRNVQILRRFPFPVFEDTNFITESIVWERISAYYDSYCSNIPIRIYHTDSPDSLMSGNGKSIARLKSSWYAAQIFINEHFNQLFYNKNILFSILNFSRLSILLNIQFSKRIKLIKPFFAKVIFFISLPVIFVYTSIKKNNK